METGLILIGVLLVAFAAYRFWVTTPGSVIAGGAVWLWLSTIGWPQAAAAAVGLVAFIASYLIHCIRKPRQRCWWCGGKANNPDATGWNSSYCWWCQGKGKKLRFGARMWKGDDD